MATTGSGLGGAITRRTRIINEAQERRKKINQQVNLLTEAGVEPEQAKQIVNRTQGDLGRAGEILRQAQQDPQLQATVTTTPRGKLRAYASDSPEYLNERRQLDSRKFKAFKRYRGREELPGHVVRDFDRIDDRYDVPEDARVIEAPIPGERNRANTITENAEDTSSITQQQYDRAVERRRRNPGETSTQRRLRQSRRAGAREVQPGLEQRRTVDEFKLDTSEIIARGGRDPRNTAAQTSDIQRARRTQRQIRAQFQQNTTPFQRAVIEGPQALFRQGFTDPNRINQEERRRIQTTEGVQQQIVQPVDPRSEISNYKIRQQQQSSDDGFLARTERGIERRTRESRAGRFTPEKAAQSIVLGITESMTDAAGLVTQTPQAARFIYNNPRRSARIGLDVGKNLVSTIRGGVRRVVNNPAGSAAVASGALSTGFRNILRNPRRSTQQGLQLAGRLGADILLGEGALRAAKITKNRFLQTTTQNIDSDLLFKQQEDIPTVESIDEALRLFDESDGIVQTVTDVGVKGNTVRPGPKGRANIEDPLLFVTPAGMGSKLRLQPKQSISLTLNPIKAIKQRLTTPETILFKTRGTRRLPKNVRETPGFTRPITEFAMSDPKNRQFAYITKRSEIGQGTVPRQKIRVLEDVELGGKTIPAGSVRRASGSTELEAGLLPITKFQFAKNFPATTVVDGQTLRVRFARVLGADDVVKLGDDLDNIKGLDDVVASQRRTSRALRSQQVSAVSPTSLSAFSTGRSIGGSTGLFSSRLSSSRGISSSGTLGSGRSSGAGSRSLASRSYSISRSGSFSSGSRSTSGSGSSGGSGGSSRSSTSGGSGGSVTISPPPKPPQKQSIGKYTREEYLRDSYDVFIKEEGQFKQLNSNGLEYDDALQLGKSTVQNTKAASVKITGRTTGGNPKKLTLGQLGAQFRSSKSTPNTFVEKKQFRIDSPGEIQDITKKGLRSLNKRGGF